MIGNCSLPRSPYRPLALTLAASLGCELTHMGSDIVLASQDAMNRKNEMNEAGGEGKKNEIRIQPGMGREKPVAAEWELSTSSLRNLKNA